MPPLLIQCLKPTLNNHRNLVGQIRGKPGNIKNHNPGMYLCCTRFRHVAVGKPGFSTPMWRLLQSSNFTRFTPFILFECRAEAGAVPKCQCHLCPSSHSSPSDETGLQPVLEIPDARTVLSCTLLL